tara:strand:- start:1235 stop:2296 length:1062 start_codon:yes stop_codon:yes gene_type:complete
MATGNYVTGGPKAALGNSAGASESEDLSNYISMITRDDTPFVSSIGKNKTDAILHEWQTDELRAPGTNAQAEGVDYADLTQNQQFRTRLGNYTQIFAEAISVSNTKRKVNQKGVADEFAYQLKKVGTEMRRDLEHTLVHSWQGKSGSGARTMGGVQAYANDALVYDATAGDFASAGGSFNGVFDGSGTFAGTQTAADVAVDIDLTHIDEMQQKVYEEGGKSTRVMVSPKNRRKISEQAQLAGSNVRREIGAGGKLRQSVDIYESDFGEVMIVPNYVMGANGVAATGPLAAAINPNDLTAICYDPMWFNVTTLRPMHETDVGPKGDSTIGMLVEECTFEAKNPKGFGLIVNIGA